MQDSSEIWTARIIASEADDNTNTESKSLHPLPRRFRWPLSFPDEGVEKEFLLAYRDDAVQVVRWATAVALIFILAFMWQDNEISPKGYIATNIRMYLAVPLCILTWYVVGLTNARCYIEGITAVFLLLYASLMVAIFLVFEPGLYGLSGAFAPGNFLILVLATFTLSYLRFVWASFVGIGVLLIYSVSSYRWTQFDAEGFVKGHLSNGFIAFALGAVTSYMFEVLRRRQFMAARTLTREKERYKQLLYTLVPSKIASRIEEGEFPIADSHAEVAILFSDFVGFTALSQQVSPRTLVQLLNELFFEFDQAAESYAVEKIKTIGDGYMAACGAPIQEDKRTTAIAHLALEMVEITKRVAEKYHFPIAIRVGIHTGSLIAGVIGKSRYTYDLWGESVNMASRMESSGIPNRVQMSESAFMRLKDHFVCEARGEVSLKGMGNASVYLLGESIHQVGAAKVI